MRRQGSLLSHLVLRFAAAAFFALSGLALGIPEEQTLLTPDGTLHSVRSGRAVDLGVADPAIAPEEFLVEWSSRAQDGTLAVQVVPGTASYQEKRGLQLGWDEQTRALLLIWTEEVSAYSHIRVGVLREGVWTNSALLPTQGISRAYNPQMRITHQRVSWLDEQDALVWKTTSILSIVWWEEAQYLQARLATLFLDEGAFDPASLAIYDLPALSGEAGDTSVGDTPSGAYLYPTLQADGLSGAVLASFADLHAERHRVVRVAFPEDRGKPSEAGNLKWQRRHIPIVGVTASGPVGRMAPTVGANASAELSVGTTIGAGYRPTMYWREGDTLKFSRLGDTDWEPVRAIAIDESMPYERALDLVVGMGGRN